MLIGAAYVGSGPVRPASGAGETGGSRPDQSLKGRPRCGRNSAGEASRSGPAWARGGTGETTGVLVADGWRRSGATRACGNPSAIGTNGGGSLGAPEGSGSVARPNPPTAAVMRESGTVASGAPDGGSGGCRISRFGGGAVRGGAASGAAGGGSRVGSAMSTRSGGGVRRICSPSGTLADGGEGATPACGRCGEGRAGLGSGSPRGSSAGEAGGCAGGASAGGLDAAGGSIHGGNGGGIRDGGRPGTRFAHSAAVRAGARPPGCPTPRPGTPVGGSGGGGTIST